jgi:hypothetical protein
MFRRIPSWKFWELLPLHLTIISNSEKSDELDQHPHPDALWNAFVLKKFVKTNGTGTPINPSQCKKHVFTVLATNVLARGQERKWL